MTNEPTQINLSSNHVILPAAIAIPALMCYFEQKQKPVAAAAPEPPEQVEKVALDALQEHMTDTNPTWIPKGIGAKNDHGTDSAPEKE